MAAQGASERVNLTEGEASGYLRLMSGVRTSRMIPPILLAAIVLGIACQPERRDTPSAGASEKGRETPPRTQEARERPGFVETSLRADPVLIGISHADSTLGVRFAPPAGWPPIDPALFEATNRARDSLFATTDRLVSRPVRMYVDHERRFYMILATFSNWPAPLDPYAAFAGYGAVVRGRGPDVEVSERTFRHGRLDIHQLFISNPVMVNYRLILLREDRLPVQVDYLLPRASYELVSGAIEASIASFERL